MLGHGEGRCQGKISQKFQVEPLVDRGWPTFAVLAKVGTNAACVPISTVTADLIVPTFTVKVGQPRIDSTNPGVLAYFIRPQTRSLGTNIESRSFSTDCICARFEGLNEFYIKTVKRLFCGYSENQIHNS
jgi:hypothetical protein